MAQDFWDIHALGTDISKRANLYASPSGGLKSKISDVLVLITLSMNNWFVLPVADNYKYNLSAGNLGYLKFGYQNKFGY